MTRFSFLAPLSLCTLLCLCACQGGTRSRPSAGEPAPEFARPVEAATIPVPDVRGKDLASARAALEASGLVVGWIEPWPDSLGYPARTIVAQRPARGTLEPHGFRVDLRIFGITAEEAAREASPPAAPVEPPPSTAYEPQPTPQPTPQRTPQPAERPAPDESAPPSRGHEQPAAGALPQLVGLSIEEATQAARRAGFDVVTLRVPGRPKDQVLSQNPPAGRPAPAGTVIGVKIASGED